MRRATVYTAGEVAKSHFPTTDSNAIYSKKFAVSLAFQTPPPVTTKSSFEIAAPFGVAA
jgi:hypothetical protein